MQRRKVIFGALVAALLLVSLVVPASGSISPAELVATLAPGESICETKTVFVPPRPPKADVVFSFDLTASMSSIISTAKTRAVDIMNALNAIPDVDIQFGVMSYMDYPYTYNSCGYSAVYGYEDDYPYRLDQGVTGDVGAVAGAINDLVLGYGADGPQDYTRIFYESYSDPAVAWRPGAKHILVNFADNIPHDCNVNEGVYATPKSTGGDPGRDEVMGTADDLDLQAVLAAMAANGVVLLEAQTTTEYNTYWTYWTGLTGGALFVTTSGSLVTDIVNAVTGALEAPVVYGLHLAASAGYESWLVSVSPPSYDVTPGEAGATVTFDITIQVPVATLPGTYNFTISALDAAGVNYGDQQVTIIVGATTGFITGGGWIDSPAGAYKPDPSLAGRATFGFVAKTQKNAAVPMGNTEFQFHAGGVNFHSEGYDSLLVTGGYARFGGVGTINRNGPYRFMVWAGDNAPDTFRIRIWQEGGEPGAEIVVYDNGVDQPIGSGSIVVHK
jgi:hypothetical protein